MGQAKIPLYAYIDETGNTGHNLFDEAQPDFFTAALITKGNFDDMGRRPHCVARRDHFDRHQQVRSRDRKARLQGRVDRSLPARR
jgi:hypothetical protein